MLLVEVSTAREGCYEYLPFLPAQLFATFFSCSECCKAFAIGRKEGGNRPFFRGVSAEVKPMNKQHSLSLCNRSKITLTPEAEFLDEIQTKVLRVFPLAIHSHLEISISSNSRNLL